MNGGLSANQALLDEIKAGLGAVRCRAGVCVPHPYLAQVQLLLAGTPIALGAQDVSIHAAGAYTGEVSASMLRDFGVRYCIVGHSERRQYHRESEVDVALKARQALACGITPIVCVGETLVQRTAEAYEATVKVGLGPLSVRFKTDVRLQDPKPPESLDLVFTGHAGALGSGQGRAQVRLEPLAGGRTQLHWWVQVELTGTLAQFGNRLVEATARKLSAEFFASMGQRSSGLPTRRRPWWRRLLQFLFPPSGK